MFNKHFWIQKYQKILILFCYKFFIAYKLRRRILVLLQMFPQISPLCKNFRRRNVSWRIGYLFLNVRWRIGYLLEMIIVLSIQSNLNNIPICKYCCINLSIIQFTIILAKSKINSTNLIGKRSPITTISICYYFFTIFFEKSLARRW